MEILKNIKLKAKKLKQDLVILHLAYQHPKTPWTAKALIILVIGYALSPIDLIPDFIPVIGFLDDLILLPLGIYWAIKLIPKDVMELCRIQAETYKWNKKKSLVAGIIIGIIWFVVIFFIVRAIFFKGN
ncbi:MAG: YkvA family protein [Aquaticitalea sp.]